LKATLRSDYRPPDYRIGQVHLAFDIRDTTTVTADFEVQRSETAAPDAPLVLDGRDLELLAIEIDGAAVAPQRYERTATGLRVDGVPQGFRLKLVTRLDPERNTALEGLYRSGPMLCTQCEAHGFSRMTCYPDRPDVLARFRVRIEAERGRFPVLLANGNLVGQGDAGGGRHFAVWEDPFPKPCYLFALVAGDLACVEDHYVTGSGRRVALRFFVDRGNEGRVPHAMASLKHAMRWDEQAYGLEYDLDTYMVVAARDFNMGAMENKGLNLFNAAYVLASPETATDADYENVEAVIGHEYFHNWTGNRVTCRDWFQLSLKEGLTVFREQQFSAAQGSAGARRIREVRALRARQFPEDAGPLAHPVRPESYVEVNNFYTTTVYEKGAEVIRMLQTVVGAEAFATGVRDYVRKHDGGAATIEDFIAAQERAGGRPLDGFRRWYSQAGTPMVEVTDEFIPAQKTYVLRLRQSTPPTPGQPDKAPVPIPIRFRLLDARGRAITARSSAPALRGDDLLVLEEAATEIRFECDEPPTPSLLRGFSAPVQLRYPYADDQLALLLLEDDDPLVRWEAAQELMRRSLHQALAGAGGGSRGTLLAALARVAARPADDALVLAELLRMPSEAEMLEEAAPADPAQVAAFHDSLRRDIARALTGPLSVWAQWEAVSLDAVGMGRRALANLALGYLASTGAEKVLDLCLRRAQSPANMTVVQGALAALKDVPGPQREQAFAVFFARSRDDDLMLDKWFALQAASRRPDALATVQGLLRHEAFNQRNPNRVRAVLGTFARENPRAFHDAGGGGYELLADQVRALDAGNPQLAARLCEPLLNWRRIAEPRAGLMKRQLERLAAFPDLSADVREKVEKALAPGAL